MQTAEQLCEDVDRTVQRITFTLIVAERPWPFGWSILQSDTVLN